MRVDLFWIGSGQTPPVWELGGVHLVDTAVPQLAAALKAHGAAAEFSLLWDATLGTPDKRVIRSVTELPGDVWHAGLRLGMGGQPPMLDFVDPVWRFNRDPDPDRMATSWRLSWRACLMRSAVLDRLGGPDPSFETLAGASLELGHRWIRNGALMRHVPALLPDDFQTTIPPDISLNDEIRFLRWRYGRVWTLWACWRRWRNGGGLGETWRAYRRFQPPGVSLPAAPMHMLDADEPALSARHDLPRVSILIPTLDRYPHLFNLLAQLRRQSISPLEIVVIDQTSPADRDTDWPARFVDLPLRVLWRDVAGQCSSRNAGLAQIRGDAVLFLDDDDEVEPDLIARHLDFIARFGVAASCGVAEEAGAGPLPPEFRLIRDSDVFPTNNSLLMTSALRGSGLFDLAYEKGERADHDLGMRLYLSGATLLLNPSASVVHLHASRGGLRQHKARVVTRSSSRASIWERQYLAPTEAFLMWRYFSPSQVHEAALIRTVGTLRGSRTGAGRWLRAVLMAIRLPDTWRQNKSRLTMGREKLKDFPAIPAYEPAAAEEHTTS